MAEPDNIVLKASKDFQTIEDFVNLPADSEVYPRLLPTTNVGTLAGAREAIFKAGGLPATPQPTKVAMEGSDLVDGDYAYVTDDTVNNGLYLKTAGTWAKSAYDPTKEAKDYADDAIVPLSLDINGLQVYKKIAGRTELIKDVNGAYRVLKTSAKTGDMVSYAKTTASSKTLIAGANVTISETENSITINSTGGSEPLFVEPTEFVLCLIVGQSNASYYGGDAALSPTVPEKVCRIWDNTYSTLLDISSRDTSNSTINNCMMSFAPALALEFYKKTGMGLIVVNSAKGSTAQVAAADNGAGHWDTGSDLRTVAVDRYNACKTYLDTNNVQYQNGFIAWAQGEQDGQKIADSTITKAQYITALKDTVSYFKTNLGSKLPFIIVRTAYRSPDNAGYQAVRDGQMQVAHETVGAYMGYTGTYRFLTNGLMADSVHYSQVGKNMVGKAMGKVSAILSAGVN